jgi:2-polyprenyl-3-methyl-5-hydroxy-6-metoxy-1,4-benzoquinol methylase
MAEKHFFEQVAYTQKYLIDYLKNNVKDFSTQTNILEIGCAEGGTIAELHNQGYSCDGIEIEEARVETAKKHNQNSATILVGDITKPIDIGKKYDLVIMRDVIEHIADKPSAFNQISKLLNKNGKLFVTFPLKYSPYAGHNQVERSWLKYVWYITLFPKFVIKMMVPKHSYGEYVYLKENALSYFSLNKLVRKDWKYIKKDFFISRPVFKIRFGWKIIKCPHIPIVKEFTNGCEVLLEKV